VLDFIITSFVNMNDKNEKMKEQTRPKVRDKSADKRRTGQSGLNAEILV
jgi:hypothetical protein